MNGRPLAVLAVAALAAGAGTYLYRSRVAETALAAPEPPPMVLAATLPDIALVDREGEMRSFDHWQGRSLIVNFWATWCAPCRREIPLLAKLQQEHSTDGFQVIGVAVDFRDKVLAYAEEMEIDYPLLIGEQEALDAAAAFGVEVVGLPFTVFSDAQGRIIAAHMGELTPAQADVILGAVRRVNAGAVTPQQARTELESELKGLPHAHAEG